MTVRHEIGENIVRNWPAYSAALGVLFVAAVSTMPPRIPKTVQECWEWMRESLQTAIPAARHPVLPQEAPNETREEHE